MEALRREEDGFGEQLLMGVFWEQQSGARYGLLEVVNSQSSVEVSRFERRVTRIPVKCYCNMTGTTYTGRLTHCNRPQDTLCALVAYYNP